MAVEDVGIVKIKPKKVSEEMNKELNEKIEQRMQELINIAYRNTVPSHRRKFPPSYNHETIKKYKALAKHTLTLELESEIRGMQSFIHSSFVQQSLDKVKELQQQIEELKNLNKGNEGI